MRITTKHHNGDRTVEMGSGRILRIPAGIITDTESLGPQGDLMGLYTKRGSRFFVSGDYAMWPEWEIEFLKHDMRGEFKPWISAKEFMEMVGFFNQRWGKHIAKGGNWANTPFGRLERMNSVRGSVTFGVFRMKMIEDDRRRRGIIK